MIKLYKELIVDFCKAIPVWMPDILMFVGVGTGLFAISKIYLMFAWGRKNEKPIYKFDKKTTELVGFQDSENTADIELELAINYLSTNKFLFHFAVYKLWYFVEFFEVMFINTYLSFFCLLDSIKDSAILGLFNLRVSYFNTSDLFSYYEYIAIRFITLILKLYTYIILSILVLMSFVCLIFSIVNRLAIYWFNYYFYQVIPTISTFPHCPTPLFDTAFQQYLSNLLPYSYRIIAGEAASGYNQLFLVLSSLEISDESLVDNFLFILPEILVFLFSFYILIKALSLLELTNYKSAYVRFVLRLWNKIEILVYSLSILTFIELFSLRLHELNLLVRYNSYSRSDINLISHYINKFFLKTSELANYTATLYEPLFKFRRAAGHEWWVQYVFERNRRKLLFKQSNDENRIETYDNWINSYFIPFRKVKVHYEIEERFMKQSLDAVRYIFSNRNNKSHVYSSVVDAFFDIYKWKPVFNFKHRGQSFNVFSNTVKSYKQPYRSKYVRWDDFLFSARNSVVLNQNKSSFLLPIQPRIPFHTYSFFLFDNLLIHDIFYLGTKLFFLILFSVFVKLLRLTINTFYAVQPEQPFLITSLLLFFLISLMSIDLNLLYICFEAITIIIVVLIAHEYSEFSLDAAVKYFSLNAITSGLFLFGTSIFYGYTLATEFLSIADFFFTYSVLTDVYDLTPILFASTLIIISFFIKLAVWPGSLWVFDVYAGCSIALLFLISVVLKVVIFFIFIRVLLYAFFYLFFYWKILLLLSAVGSLLFSAIGLSLEVKLNSFIAYSSIGQFGFMLLGFTSYQNVQTLNSILLYLISYCTAICGVFLLLPIIFGYLYGNNNISQLIGFYKKSFFISFVLTILLASLAGLPPFLGFFVKYRILKLVVASTFSFGLILLILFTTIVTIYGYFRLIAFIWFDPNGKGFGSLGNHNTFEGSIFSVTNYNTAVTNIWNPLNVRVRGLRLFAYLDTPWYAKVSNIPNKVVTTTINASIIGELPFFFYRYHHIYNYFFADIGKNWLKADSYIRRIQRRFILSFSNEKYLMQFTLKYGLVSLIIFFIFVSLHLFGFFTIWLLSNITEYYSFHFFYPNLIDSKTWFLLHKKRGS